MKGSARERGGEEGLSPLTLSPPLSGTVREGWEAVLGRREERSYRGGKGRSRGRGGLFRAKTKAEGEQSEAEEEQSEAEGGCSELRPRQRGNSLRPRGDCLEPRPKPRGNNPRPRGNSQRPRLRPWSSLKSWP